jgi:thiol:disulfide interchange protein DsbD
MKNFFLSLLTFATLFSAQGQILQPANWSYAVSESSPEVGDEIDLVFKVVIDRTWYLYSSDFDPECGPIVTTFEFTPDASYQLVGEVKPIGAKKKFDDIFECEYTYFRKTAEFRQTVKVLATKLNIQAAYEYQVCTDVDGKCITFDDVYEFGADITAVAKPAASVDLSDEATPTYELAVVDEPDTSAVVESAEEVVEETVSEDKITTTPIALESEQEDTSLLGFMLLAFVTGLAALITPCVFPMIPMTVTFFMKDNAQGKSKGIRNGLIFGVSIVLIYTLLGTLFAFILGAEGLNAMATHWLPNILIFIIFIIFALSFLGLFEITLPSALVNKVDQQSDRGGMVGIFFMAFTLGLVSFSCTVPIVGSILVLSAGGEIIKPILGMLSFSMAFAMPFTLFAIFPEWLKGLPKSGGWLNSVKVILGLLELALGLKFLSVADQAYHWGLLDREIYLAFWIVIFTVMGLYLLGKIILPHDSKLEKVGVFRLLLAIGTFTFVMYLVPGMFGAPLKALAGYLPPMSTHDFDVPSMIRANGGGSTQEDTLCDVPKYADFLHFPHGIQGYFDYDQALACAKQQNKPIFIDFTGHGCVNCREMEARVWSDQSVLDRLNNDFVMLAMYVDDKTTLPESEWFTSTYDDKVKKTIGRQNANYQITRFQNNAQPYYIILNTEGELLVQPRAYDLSISGFIEFLDTGKAAFDNK